MKKRVFKFGAALTAALMVFSATASLAFADEVVPEEPETVVEEVVEETVVEEETEEPAEEAGEVDETEVADEAEVAEVEVPLETGTVEDAEAALAAVEDVATGSVITIGDISSTSNDQYYTVSVPFTVENAPNQMTFFVYDITKIADGNNTTSFSSTTPVGYINQDDGATTGTYTFKLSKANYTDDSVIVVKIGGTGVETPDAKSYSLAGSTQGKIGDADGNGTVDNGDAILVMRYYMNMADETELDMSVSDTYAADGSVDNRDAISIMKFYMNQITELPEMP